MAVANVDLIRGIVREILEERFEGIEILSINIEDDVDADGDRILKVKVVFEAHKRDTLDASRVSGLARKILPKLAEIHESGFPIFSFIAKTDLGKMSPEAA